MQEHVIFRISFEIASVIVDRHFVQWQPTVFWLAEMSHENDITFRQMIEDWIELRIIDHH